MEAGEQDKIHGSEPLTLKIPGNVEATWNKPHECNICGKCFILVSSLKIHALRHTPRVPHICLVCDRVFDKRQDFQLHVLMHRAKKEGHVSDFDESQFQLKEDAALPGTLQTDCEKSLYLSMKGGVLRMEIESERLTPDFPKNVESMGATHLRKNAVISPQKGAENIDKAPNTPPSIVPLQVEVLSSKEHTNSFQCPVCKKDFVSDVSFNEHQHTIAHQCEKCKKFYSSCLNLKRHMKCHLLNLKCKECKTAFATRQSLRLHVLTHGKKEKCPHCEKICRNQRMLTIHVNKMHKDGKVVKCKDCGLELKRADLKKHKLVVHGTNETHQCQECGVTFGQLHELWNHMKFKNHEEDILQCEICFRTLSSKKALETHRLTHTAKQECNIRGLELMNENRLKKNMTSFHASKRSIGQAKRRQKRQERQVQCDICGNMYGKSYIQTHLKIHAGQKDFECYQCGKKFTSHTNLREHQRIHSQREKYSCKECNKTFVTAKSLRIHSRKHTGETPHRCSVCSRSFVTSWTLKNHLRLHDLLNAFSCDLCGKKFGQKKSLLAHYGSDVHSKEELEHLDPQILKSISTKYQCTICGKNCHEKTMFTSHMRTHTGEKPFKCEKCDRTFRVESALKTHLKFHSGELKYECKVCKKPFMHYSLAVKHEQLHNNNRPHLCCECGRSFLSKSKLKTHMERHIIKSVYSCACCGQEFSFRQKCLVHQKSCSQSSNVKLHASDLGSWDSTTAVEYYNSVDKFKHNGDSSFVQNTVEESIECFEYSLDFEDDSIHPQVVFNISEGNS